MQQLFILQQVIDYIDEHLKEELDPESLAKMVGYSPYHFYRIFQKHIGYSLMDYVLKRKLQFALHELTRGKKVIDIALDYGFQTHAGFTRAFSRCFGSPPSLYKLHCPLSKPPKPDLMTIQKKKLGGVVMQPKMVKRPAFWVAGITFDGNIENVSYTRDEPAYWNRRGLTDGSVETFLYEKIMPSIHGEYCINLNSNETDGSFTYLFAVKYEEHHELPEGTIKFKIPAGEYAIFKTPLVTAQQFVPTIIGTWQYILEDWLPQSSYEVDCDAFDFEYYDEHCHHWEFERIYMEIHIPIKKKGSSG